ncbi:hypothetical protein EUTSA_v10006330mg [Eutrema salsugineum]|uniref:Uncharacterized protein n=1 Tax=Eutrema salsugineum TaxID=72664 RepID=V4LJM0_EUTSA|nr:hypothetical protein EUTSA_v10006330mg [Eutrema salsugineum]
MRLYKTLSKRNNLPKRSRAVYSKPLTQNKSISIKTNKASYIRIRSISNVHNENQIFSAHSPHFKPVSNYIKSTTPTIRSHLRNFQGSDTIPTYQIFRIETDHK